MPYPTIPLKGYWDNPVRTTANSTRIAASRGGVVYRSRSQLINSTREEHSIQGIVTNYFELDPFLKARNGKPFQYEPFEEGVSVGNFTCVSWNFIWKVYIPETGIGVWEFSGTFIEDHNPVNE